MREIHELLNQRWVLKKRTPELYFKLKDQYEFYKPFFRDKLGYNILINPLLIKAEKIPGRSEVWMGIQAFETPQAYVFLCLVLMFLEEKDIEEQFVLSQITEFLQNHYPGEKLDWTVFSKRKVLIQVLKFCSEEGLIVINDGNESGFTGSIGSVEVLYENTGASKYFMRRFNFDVSEVRNFQDIERSEWQSQDKDRGLFRRYRVYRRLVMSPIVYQDNEEDQDYLYIKKQRSMLENDFTKYIQADFHLHKNGAILMMFDNLQLADVFPNRKNISDIVLQLCQIIQRELSEGTLHRSHDDAIILSEVRWDELIKTNIKHNREGWIKEYREISFDKLKDRVMTIMTGFGMLTPLPKQNEIKLNPAVGKMAGSYPKEYLKKKEGLSYVGTMAD